MNTPNTGTHYKAHGRHYHLYASTADLLNTRPLGEPNLERAEELDAYLPLHTGWYGAGCQSAEEVARFFQGGVWEEGVNKILALADDLDAPRPTTRRRVTRRGPDGDQLDLDSVYAGQLDRAWITRRRAHVAGPSHIAINLDVTANSKVSEQVFFWRSAAALKLADMLTKAGYAVQINAYAPVRNLHINIEDGHTFVFPAKPYADKLDLHKLALTTAFAGFFRHFIFKAFLSVSTQPVRDTMGQSDHVPLKLPSQADIEIGGFVQVSDQRSGQQFIKDKLQELRRGSGQAA